VLRGTDQLCQVTLAVVTRGQAPDCRLEDDLDVGREVSAMTDETRGRIAVGIDGSAGSDEALRWALDEARLRHASLDVVHAWTCPRSG
jgi:hypothetical protein